MAAHDFYEPLHVVPPIDETKRRYAIALWLKERAEQAYNAMVSAPRRAAAYAARLVQKLGLHGPLAWLRSRMTRLIRPLTKLAGRLGLSGLAAGVVTAVTSPTGRSWLKKVTGAVGTAVGWAARSAYSLVDRGLRLFGSAGNRAADALFDALVSLGGRIAVIAAPVVHRIARLSDPETPHIRLLAGLARSFLVHRVLRVFVRNPIARFVVELVVSGAAFDTRPTKWLRDAVDWLRARAKTVPAKPSTTRTKSHRNGGTNSTTAPNPPRSSRPTTPTGGDPLIMPTWDPDGDLADDDLPEPTNRAERRLRDRQNRRNRPITNP